MDDAQVMRTTLVFSLANELLGRLLQVPVQQEKKGILGGLFQRLRG